MKATTNLLKVFLLLVVAADIIATTPSVPGVNLSTVPPRISPEAVVAYCDDNEAAGDYSPVPPRPKPKSPTAAPLAIFRQALKNALIAWRHDAKELDASHTNKMFISGRKVFGWLDESGSQLDIAIAEKG